MEVDTNLTPISAPILAVMLGVLGAVMGSFIATLIIRWPQGRGVATGRSACDQCGATVSARDLVPLLSHALLRGRCRDCSGRIDPLHWQVEAACVVLGAAPAIFLPLPEALVVALAGWLLLPIAVIDARHFWLPDRLTALLAVAGIGAGLARLGPMTADRLIGGAAGFGVLWLIAAAYRRLRGREGLGGGDPKLLGAIGLWTGWQLLPAILVIAGMIGIGVVAVRAAGGQSVRGDDRLPFGALMALAAYPAIIFLLANGL